MIMIPKQPDVLRLPVGRLWNGSVCPDKRLSGLVEVQQTEDTILVRARTPALPARRIPDTPVGSRVDRLWEYDVMEVFFVDEDGQYLEVEIGPGGHYLVLGFEGPRCLVADFVDLPFTVRHEVRPDRSAVNELLIPRELFPTSLRAVNAFLIAGGQYLAYHPVPGTQPDFHQPDTFPFARLV
ncbi:hypothetical protein HY734_02170 [Candidatus Uhrbacteria bacterium]|nr:hypothetical protein [Candidatus Uhrbacteria bacterium]